MNQETESYLAGIIDGDGHVGYNKGHYFMFSSIDFEFVDKVALMIEEEFGYKPKIYFPKIKGNRQQLKTISVYKNEVALNIQSSKIKDYPPYLSALFDSEGHASYKIRKDGYEELEIGLVTCEQEILVNALIGFSTLGIELNSLREEILDSGRTAYRIKIKINPENVMRFLKLVNPTIKRKRESIVKYLSRRF